jgi:hypothetical protein
MKDIARLIHEPGATVAIVGATDNPGKYGSVIYRDLKRKGFRVFGVNPNRSVVDGDPAYPDLGALPEAPTLVNFVVPPEATLTVLKEADTLGYKSVWVQPGAESPEVIRYLQENEFNYLANSCIMIHSRFHSDT